MPNKLDIAGNRYGRLVAATPTDQRSGGKIVWRCLCDCGMTCFAAVNHLQNGQRVSCGCAKIAGQQIQIRKPRHGHFVGGSASPTYYSWSSMRTRCQNPNAPDYHRYGGRGISICPRWDVFENFLADMGERPMGKTLDRVDVNGNYGPNNCRWATDVEQQLNRRNSRLITAFGETKNLAVWSREFGVPEKTITDRLARGWSMEGALTGVGTRGSRWKSSARETQPSATAY